jgi:hypothetical protein
MIEKRNAPETGPTEKPTQDDEASREKEIRQVLEVTSEAALDLVVGGIWDNPLQDKMNQNRAAANSGEHTFGGSIGGQTIASPPGMMSGNPIEYPM